jgi:hypothetical protein
MSPNSTPPRRADILSPKGDSNADGEVMGIGVCPNAFHRSKTVFVRHMEERLTWEKIIAGVDRGESVPIKWRGCLNGCLAFLDNNTGNLWDSSCRQRQEAHTKHSQTTAHVDDDIETDDLVVKSVSLVQDGFGDQDFEEDA